MRIDAEDLAVLIAVEGVAGTSLILEGKLAKSRLDKLVERGLIYKLTRNTPNAVRTYLDERRTPHSIDISSKGRSLVKEIKKMLAAVDCEFDGAAAFPRWRISID